MLACAKHSGTMDIRLNSRMLLCGCKAYLWMYSKTFYKSIFWIINMAHKAPAGFFRLFYCLSGEVVGLIN